MRLSNGSERRKYIRVGKSLLVSYTVIDAAEGYRETVTRNISGGGIRLPLKEKLAIGTLLKLELELLKEKKRIQLEAKVIWIRPNPEDKGFPYEAGIEFINIGFAERTMLSNCVQYLDRDRLLKEFFTK